MARTPPSRLSSGKILRELRAAAKKGDRASLTLAVDQMRTLALSPRYWEKYLGLLRSPLARLVDLLVIKQGDRIAHQKGWRLPPPRPSRSRDGARARRKAKAAPRESRRRRDPAPPAQPSLFD
ncbi:MAG: hypothetical protein HY727_22015 [Candidatus Rokubacteria bacterium]|nr:hypothetical protein [Candidatus Rokubacteria bacterium]